MTLIRQLAIVVLAGVFAISLAAGWVAPFGYSQQLRESPNQPPDMRFHLGTDDLGRDRFSRLLYGSRISLLLAPAAALISLLVAASVGISAGILGGWWDAFAMRATDLLLSLPWLFLFLTVRAVLPLNTAPYVTVVITFATMGLLGWGPPARVIRAAVREMRTADFVVYARACGCRESRIWGRHLVPAVKSLLLAQFWIAVPLFILGEASLGLLGLGVGEPLPSWGNLLRELETAPGLHDYWLFAPVALLALVVTCFQLAAPSREIRA